MQIMSRTGLGLLPFFYSGLSAMRGSIRISVNKNSDSRNDRLDQFSLEMKQIEYDEYGRASKAISKDQQPIRFDYDDAGSLIATRIRDEHHRFETDLWGRLVEHERPDGTRTRWHFNARGFLAAVEIKTLRPKPPGAEFQPDEYDSEKTIYQRDRLGRVTQVFYPDGGKEHFRFDRKGRVYAWDPAVGGVRHRTRYAYDRLDRLARIDYPFERNVRREEFSYHPGGKLKVRSEIRNGERRPIKNEYEYDYEGQLVAESLAGMGRTEYRYDARGRRHHVIHPDGTDTRYTFDDMNRISAIRGSHQPPIDITYDALGHRTVTPVRSEYGITQTNVRGVSR